MRLSLASQIFFFFRTLACNYIITDPKNLILDRLLSWIETECLVERPLLHPGTSQIGRVILKTLMWWGGRGGSPQDVGDRPCGPTMATRSRNVGYYSTNGSWHALLPIPKTFPSAFFAPSSSTWVTSAPRGGEEKGEACLEKLPYLNPAVGIPGHLNRGTPNHLNASKGASLILHWRRTKGVLPWGRAQETDFSSEFSKIYRNDRCSLVNFYNEFLHVDEDKELVNLLEKEERVIFDNSLSNV